MGAPDGISVGQKLILFQGKPRAEQCPPCWRRFPRELELMSKHAQAMAGSSPDQAETQPLSTLVWAIRSGTPAKWSPERPPIFMQSHNRCSRRPRGTEKPIMKAGATHKRAKARGNIPDSERRCDESSRPPSRRRNHQAVHGPNSVPRTAPPGQKVGHIAPRRTGRGREPRKSEALAWHDQRRYSRSPKLARRQARKRRSTVAERRRRILVARIPAWMS